jgi:uncharacterized repeat protein (TIGR03803 family)
MTYQGRTTRDIFLAVAATLLAVSALAQDSEKVLHTFTGGKDGGFGGTQLVADSAGNLYGTTFAGGNKSAECAVYTGLHGCGVVFKLSPTEGGSWTETVLHTFSGGKDGGVPTSGVVLDSAGNLYGATLFGGDSKPANCHLGGAYARGCGVVYKLTPTAHGPWTQTVLYKFTGSTDGFEPWDRLIFDASGNLYGTTGGGGNLNCNPPYGCGTVFELSPGPGGSWTESVLYAFGQASDGESPFSGVTFDSQGNLYGTTLYGGDTSVSCNGIVGCGTIFQLAPTLSGPWTETVLHAFTGGPDGAYPLFNVILDSSGNIYGSTLYGGDTTSYDCRGGVIPGCGVVFELTQGTWGETVLYPFTGGADGVWPISPLVFDPSGNLYGVTRYGGGIGNGMVYELTPTGQGPWIQTNLYAFDGGHDGAEPESNLVFDSSGNLYGMTNNGGNRTECNRGGCGVVFELQP